MSPGPRQLYWGLLIIGFFGYLWLGWSVISMESEKEVPLGCLFKFVYGFPCPSCGTTRSILQFVSGDIFGSLTTNPLGLISMVALLVVPFWAILDVTLGKRGLIRFYRAAEIWIRTPLVGIPIILLVLVNWIWNIAKEL
jgi:hypothetical protein